MKQTSGYRQLDSDKSYRNIGKALGLHQFEEDDIKQELNESLTT